MQAKSATLGKLACGRQPVVEGLIAGIETMHKIKQGQLQCPDGKASCAAASSTPCPSDSKPLLDAFSRTPLLRQNLAELPELGKLSRRAWVERCV